MSATPSAEGALSATLAALLVAIAASAAAPPADAPLLSLAGRLPTAEGEPGVVAAHDAALDLARLATGPAEAAFELPGGRLLAARRLAFERRRQDGLLWHGRAATGEEVVVTVRAGRAVGTLFTPEAVFQLLPSADAGLRLVEVDTAGLPDCGGAPLPAADPWVFRSSARDSAGAAAPRIDLLVLYTVELRQVIGSRAILEALVQHHVDLTNVTFRNSQVAARARLVGLEEVDPPASIKESNDDALRWVRETAEVARLRDQAAADIVGLLYEHESPSCGSANMIFRPGADPARAVFEMQRGCFAKLSFTHELGHLLGGHHNPEDADDPASDEYPDGRGHYHDGRYRTVMAYDSRCELGCPQQPFLSNPDVSHDRAPTGILDERDNARVIDELAGFVALFKTGPGDDDVCPLEPGDRDYCALCGPCRSGEGNCASDAECDPGLVCVKDAGAQVGLPRRTDLCLASDDCSLVPGDAAYCRLCGPCGYGEGDCGGDRECQPGLSCIEEAGATFGYAPMVDVCAYVEYGDCPVPLGHRDYCRLCGRCDAGEGHCRDHGDCRGPRVRCTPGVGAHFGFPPETSVCLSGPPGENCAVQPGTRSFCSACGLCDVGEGDCDGDRQCLPGLVCVDGVGADVGFGPFDVCLEGAGVAPRAPSKLRARVRGPDRVTLRWRDRSRDEEGFEAEMREERGAFERVAAVGPDVGRLMVRGLAPGTTYTFRVRAFAGSLRSKYSNRVTVTTHDSSTRP